MTKSLIVLCSYHNGNTAKLADAMAGILNAEVAAPGDIDPDCLGDFGLLGFGSGIYDGKHHRSILELAEKLPRAGGARAFIFSTCGVPAKGFTEALLRKNHGALRDRLESKGYPIADEFGCVGWNSNSFLKLFGGINKGRPDAGDLGRARAFAERVLGDVGR